MFERFTERARQVPIFAEQEARALGRHAVGTEHLLLGLMHEEEGLAAVVLDSLGVTIDAVREQAAQVGHSGGEPTGGRLPFTPEAKKALELSLREALALGHNHIGTEHVLLGIAHEEHGAGALILEGLGVDGRTLRNAITSMLPGRPRRHGPPSWARRRRHFRALAWAREEALEEGNYDLARKLLELDIEQRERIAATPETERRSMRTVTLVHHRVADFDAWKQVFDSFKGAMREGGIREGHVWRDREDPNTVVVISVFDGPDEAHAFFERADLREAMGNAGVDASTLRIEFLDEVEGGEA